MNRELDFKKFLRTQVGYFTAEDVGKAIGLKSKYAYAGVLLNREVKEGNLLRSGTVSNIQTYMINPSSSKEPE